MKKIAVLLIMLFLLVNLFTTTATAAPVDDMSIYIRNKPYNNTYLIKSGKLYIPAQLFLKALGFNWVQKGNDIYILTYVTDDSSSDITGEDAVYHYKDAVFKVDNFTRNGQLYIAAAELSRNMSIAVMYNGDTRIIDILMPNFNAPQTTTAHSSGSKTSAVAAEEEASPVKATVQSYQNYDPNHQEYGGTVSGTVNIVNTSDKEVPDVEVILHITDEAGQDLYTQTYPIGTMQPGQQVQKEFYWSNPNPLLAYKTETEVKHGKIEGEEEKKQLEVQSPTGLEGQVPAELITPPAGN
ncbi:MAG: hypothetical protein ABIH00_10455 [Armatimonadota bacterium]